MKIHKGPVCPGIFHSARPSSSRRGYGAAWRKFRAWFLSLHPFCSVEGCGQPATEVDHIIPLENGGAHLDPTNSQSLCKPCHSAKTYRENKSRCQRGKARRRK